MSSTTSSGSPTPAAQAVGPVQQCIKVHTLDGASGNWSMGVWLLILFWMSWFSFLAGIALAGAGECEAGWVWNPIKYVRLMSQIQASPWSWSSPEMTAIFHESRMGIFGGMAAALGSTAAFCMVAPVQQPPRCLSSPTSLGLLEFNGLRMLLIRPATVAWAISVKTLRGRLPHKTTWRTPITGWLRSQRKVSN